MYPGLIALAMRHPRILAVDAGTIHEHDNCEWVDGTAPRLTIRRKLGAAGEAVAFYAVTHYAGGVSVPVVMGREEIEAYRREHSGGKVWASNFEAMALKTVVRRAAKMWPIDMPPE